MYLRPHFMKRKEKLYTVRTGLPNKKGFELKSVGEEASASVGHGGRLLYGIGDGDGLVHYRCGLEGGRFWVSEFSGEGEDVDSDGGGEEGDEGDDGECSGACGVFVVRDVFDGLGWLLGRGGLEAGDALFEGGCFVGRAGGGGGGWEVFPDVVVGGVDEV